MDDQSTDESVRINSRIYVSEISCVSPQGDEAELSQKIASLKWHRRELQVSVVELECVAVKLFDELACSPDGAEESAGGGGEGRASSPAAQDCLQDPAIGSKTSEHQQRPLTNRLKIANTCKYVIRLSINRSYSQCSFCTSPQRALVAVGNFIVRAAAWAI